MTFIPKHHDIPIKKMWGIIVSINILWAGKFIQREIKFLAQKDLAGWITVNKTSQAQETSH